MKKNKDWSGMVVTVYFVSDLILLEKNRSANQIISGRGKKQELTYSISIPTKMGLGSLFKIINTDKCDRDCRLSSYPVYTDYWVGIKRLCSQLCTESNRFI